MPLRKQDHYRTAFASKIGLHQLKRMPFVFCNVIATFQHVMAKVLTGVTQAYGYLVTCYVVDVPTENVDQHLSRLAFYMVIHAEGWTQMGAQQVLHFAHFHNLSP